MLLSLAGGYLLVTATSSPQQQPIARILGGSVPEASPTSGEAHHGVIEEATELPIVPSTMRLVLGTAGAALHGVALVMVFGTAIHLLLNPVWPQDMPTIEDLMTGALR